MTDPYPQSQPHPAPMGQLVLNLRKPQGPFSASIISPRATIDGYPAPVRWEQNAFPVTPGPHHVHVAASYLWQYGPADQPVTIYPGQSVEVHYSPPAVTLGVRGRIGFAPQPVAGMAAVWVILGIPVLVLLIVAVAIATS